MSAFDVADFITRVNDAVNESLQRHRVFWEAQSGYTSTIFDEISILALGGGKKLRPQFCAWGWIAAGGEKSSITPVHLGAAVELLHAMALFHDDVIDDASLRRGNQTTHRRFADIHQSSHLLGESRRFGEGVAILIGDITAVMADEFVSDVSPSTRHIWNRLRLEMNIGQFLDTVGSAYKERSTQFAETVFRNKTAKYTIEGPLHLGAYAADVERAEVLEPMLSQYGLPLGDAFQLRDDILGAFGDETEVGKSVGGDFLEGKPTLLLARAYEKASMAQRVVLDRVGQTDLSEKDIAAIVQIIEETKTRDEVETLIQSLAASAIEALQKSQLPEDAYNALVELAHLVTNRSL